MLALGQSPLQPDQYRSSIKSPVLLYSSNYTYAQSNHKQELRTLTNLLLQQTQKSKRTRITTRNCFCNTELRTAIVSKIKGLPIPTQLNMFVLFYIVKITLDERKTLTKNSPTISQCSPKHCTTRARSTTPNVRTEKRHLA